jgi:transcriptional coactivator HFI1/ADA1
VRGRGGELPVEAEERRKRKALCMEDLRLALQLGDSYLGQTPLIAGEIVQKRFLDTPGVEEIYNAAAEKEKPLINGIHGAMNAAKYQLDGETWTVDVPAETMQGDEDMGLHWQGGRVQDLSELDDALEDILNIGDL